MTTHDVFFLLAGLITAGSAVLAVSTRQALHSALWLVVSMAALSGCYLVLGAELVALVNLLVYVGAIVVLVIFAMMLTQAPRTPTELSVQGSSRWAALAVSSATGALVAATVISGVSAEPVAVRAGDSAAVAQQVFGTWAWPLELLSVLLLVALVSALALLRLRLPDGPGELEAEPQ